jgi:lipopolysaccharide transport system ATP-binding protein
VNPTTRELVRLTGVSKVYPRLSRPSDRLRALRAVLAGSRDYPGYSVLREVSLQILAGRSLGVIGANGAGKSTLLKMIAGVVKPTKGSVTVSGSMGALLELGAGFHPEYTGRDNILLSGMLMGMDEAELRAKLSDIIAFADIGAYIDEPIKHYSSGMIVRLGFAVVSTMRPELLITDEVLAVGDESFQKKCISWIERYLADGGTLILCSHSMFHVQKLCEEALWIHQGEVRAVGDTFDITQEYLAYQERKSARESTAGLGSTRAAAEYRVSDVALSTAGSPLADRVAMGDDLTVDVLLRSPDGRPPGVHVGIVRVDGTPVYGVTADADDFVPVRVTGTEYRFMLRFDELALLPARYSVRVHAMDPEGIRLFDTMEREFRVTGACRDLGICRLQHRWFTPGPVVDDAS